MPVKLTIPTPRDFFGKSKKEKNLETELEDLKQKLDEIQKANKVSPTMFNVNNLSQDPGGGYKRQFTAGIGFKALREFADYYPIARACIEFRKSQITQMDWHVSPLSSEPDDYEKPETKIAAKDVKARFRYPTGNKSITFSHWMKQILEDLMVIDAVALYKRKNRAGEIIGYLPLDGTSIEIVLNKDGTIPDPPRAAYVQKVGGEITAELSTDELYYRIMNPRTTHPFGMSPLEHLVIIVTTALKLQSFNLSYLSDGNVPEGFVEIPRDIASSRDQLKEWQDAWDAFLSGDPRFQRKLKFLPEGMTYTATKRNEDMTFERFEKWLLQNTCAIFGVQPSQIGFNFETNRSVKETDFEVGKERGLFPTALFIKELMDDIVQNDLGYEELEFRWSNLNPTNRVEEAKVVTSLIDHGLMAIDEWRVGEGLKPTGAKDPFISTPIGPIFVKDLAKQSEQGLMPILPYKPVEQGKAGDSTGSGAVEAPNVPNAVSQSAKKSDMGEFTEEIKRWRKCAVNDFKKGEAFRDFSTDIIDTRTQHIIKDGLNQSKSREDINEIFDAFLSPEYQTKNQLMDFYGELDAIISNSDTRGNTPIQTPIGTTWPYQVKSS